MPCNMLAVQQAQVQMNERLLSAIFGNALALAALGEAVQTTMGVQASIWNDQETWWSGYRAYSSGAANHQTVPVARIANADAQYIDICTADGTFRIERNGRITVRDGWIVGKQGLAVEATLAALQQTLATVGVIVAQNMVAMALQSAGVLVAEEVAANGARVLTVEV